MKPNESPVLAVIFKRSTPMVLKKLKHLLIRMRVWRLLETTGIRIRLRWLILWMTNPTWRNRERELKADFRWWREKYGLLLKGVQGPTDASRRVLVVSLTAPTLVHARKLEALLAKALQLRGYTPVILTLRSFVGSSNYHRIFGFNQFVFLDDFVGVDSDNVFRAEARNILDAAVSWEALIKAQYRGVNIGKHVAGSLMMNYRSIGILRTYENSRNAFPKPQAMREQTEELLVKAMQWVHASETVLDRVKPDMIITDANNHIPLGEIFDVAFNRGIDAIMWCFTHRDDALSFKRYSSKRGEQTRHQHPFSLSDETWEWVQKMPWSAQNEQELFEMFRTNYAEGKWFGRRWAYSGTLQNKEEIINQLGLTPTKKTAIVFSHVLWDATFSFGHNLFDDYEEWLIETVKSACNNPHVNWIIKLHPHNIVQGEWRERIAIREHVGELPDHVMILDPDTTLSAFSLFEVADYCLTVRGTVGMEGACFGATTITAGTGRYWGRGFTVDPATREEYLDALKHIQDIPKSSPEQVELARRYCYGLFMLRPCPFTSINLEYTRRESPINPQVILGSTTPEQFQNAEDFTAFSEWAVNTEHPDFMTSKS